MDRLLGDPDHEGTEKGQGTQVPVIYAAYLYPIHKVLKLQASAIAAIAALPTTLMLVALHPFAAQAGGSCVAYSDGRQVATYSCDFDRDSAGRVTFIEWEHGTASVNLGGWRRVSASCFGASENLSWRICANGPACSDEATLRIAVKVYRASPAGGETVWRSSTDVLINKGDAKLNGEPGDLYTYDVQGTRIKNFVATAGSTNLYSFDGSTWIRMTEQTQSGQTDVSHLAPNILGITKEHYTETTTTRRVCR